MGLLAFIVAVLLAFMAWGIGLAAAAKFGDRDSLAGWVGVILASNSLLGAAVLCIMALRA